MKTLLVTSTICAVISTLVLLLFCMSPVDEAPTPWDFADRVGLVLLTSVLLWWGVAIWSGLRLRKKTPHAVALWLRIVMILISAGYISMVVTLLSQAFFE
jgi:hypothetical protein